MSERAENPTDSYESNEDIAERLAKRFESLKRFVVVCSECQAEMSADWNFCTDCGARLATECPSCHQPLPPYGARFCPHCGYAMPERPA
jgi:predicted amidophosphoribosyltransferase